MYQESDTIELKRELNKNIKKEIVAFANTKGGTIFIGIDDDGSIIGLNNANKNVEAISSIIHDGIINDLTPYCNIEIQNVDNKEIIAIHITSAPNKPYYIAEKGLKPSGVYLRLGSSSINATDEIIRKMIVDNKTVSFEKDISNNQELTFNYAKTVFEENNILFDTNKYKSLKLITDQKFNNLALLLSDQNPYTIKCAVFDGKDKTFFKDRKEFTGSCFKQINDAFEYLNLVNRIASTFEGLIRIDKKDYPDFSLREALLNSIIHRTYYYDASILLSIFDDRIEINSIGGLLGTLTLNDVYNGVSESRNPNLAELFHRLNYVENYGTGIGRILKEYKDDEVKPSIELSENVFRITLPNRNYVEVNDNSDDRDLSQEEIIIEYLKNNDTITRETFEQLLNLSKSGSRYLIGKMIDNNLIVQKGTGRSTYYELK
jgi:ATP-dependent DNA helicase RecG